MFHQPRKNKKIKKKTMENGGKTMEHAMNMYRTVETIN
jgi:hypothetical protein